MVPAIWLRLFAPQLVPKVTILGSVGSRVMLNRARDSARDIVRCVHCALNFTPVCYGIAIRELK